MKSDAFISTFQIKRTSWSQKSNTGETKYSKYYKHDRSKCYGHKLPMFVIGKEKSRMLKKCQVFTLLLQKSTKKLDGWETVWRVTPDS